MANDEATFRRELARAFAAQGHVVTIAMRAGGGVPDLYVKMRGLPAFWLELKYARPSKRGVLPVQLSTLQRHFLAWEQAAGGFAGWAVCTPVAPRFGPGGKNLSTWDCYAGNDPEKKAVLAVAPTTQRAMAQPWDVRAIAEKILCYNTPWKRGKDPVP